MNAERWQKVQDIFNQASTLPDAGEAAAFLKRTCPDDTALREEVASLLAAHRRASRFMERPAVDDVLQIVKSEPERAAAGRRIGAYKIVREIGCGGMGTVYLAGRDDDEYRKLVAIKIVRRGHETEDIVRRFRNERQILAALEHPNIARLIDGGQTSDGLPYLVMEYVEGTPITDYCDEHRLTTNKRLELFRTICAAVQHAHQNLVVHRDLKPSNILITRDGTPKLLDFGISKVLDPELSAHSLEHTRTELRMLTPDYASPEQVRGEKLTTTSDVYSLGVVLYELLTGHRPYDATAVPSHELARIVCEQEPTKPSDSISDFGMRNAESKTNRQSAITNWRSLRGDLDNIVLMALRKEPHRRYISAAQLSTDIHRHLEGLPVIARKDTFKYRAGKFVKRNKVGVAAAALVVLSLLAGFAVALTQAQRATVQARIANEQRDEAQRARERAEKTSRFMQSFLDYANPNWYGRGRGRTNVTVREAIDAAAGRIDTELADAPEVRADLHYTVGEIYRVAGEYEIAHKHFRASLDLYRQVHGEQHPKVARGLYYLSIAVNRGGTSRGEESQLLLRQGIAIMRQTDPDNINLPYMLQSLAGWIMLGEEQSRNESRLAEAENLILEAKTLFVRHYGENHIATFSADNNLATLAFTRGDLARAESMWEENLRHFRQTDEGDYNHNWALFYLAEVKLALGKKAEAEMLFNQALEMGRKQWGADNFQFERLVRDINQTRATTSR